MSASRPTYRRSTGGLLAAMVITVLAVVAFVGFRAIFRDNDATPVRTVDYQTALQQGREDGRLAMLAPTALPEGWRATSASYERGPAPRWHLGMLTDDGKYVGVEEARASARDLAEEHVDENPNRDGTVRIGQREWLVWRDSGGDYALSRALTGADGERETVLVVGSASEDDVRHVATSLRGR